MRVLICLLVLACASDVARASNCPEDSVDATNTKRSIALLTSEPRGYFYYRVDHYLIQVDPADFNKRLSAFTSRSSSRLAKDIRELSRTFKNLDLYYLNLRNWLYISQIELLLADILESGNASIVDVFEPAGEPGRFVSTLAFTRIQRDMFSARQFCTTSGDLIFEYTDLHD